MKIADSERHTMTVSYFVRYQGVADDADAFVQHYRTQHVPILRQFPRIRGIVLHRPVDWRDPFQLPDPDPRALHALGDALGGSEPATLSAFMGSKRTMALLVQSVSQTLSLSST